MVSKSVEKPEIVCIGKYGLDPMITRTVEQHNNGNLTMSGICAITGIPILYIHPMKMITIKQELN